MYNSWFKLALSAVAILTITAPSVQGASTGQVEFSADLVQSGPQGMTSEGRIFVGRYGVRTEMSQDGKKVVQVHDKKNQVTRILFPEQRSYMEQPGPGPAPGSSGKGMVTNPCQGMPGAQCRNLGKETISGRTAVKWEVTIDQQGQTLRSTQWIDAERGMPLRQETERGRMELIMVGVEQLAGRKVEKWQMEISAEGQPLQTMTQWFDPQLSLAIREEFPGGMVREMRNIRVGTQDPSLFTVPSGYQKIDPQQFNPQKQR